MHQALVLTPDLLEYQAALARYALTDLRLYYADNIAAAQPFLAHCDIVLGQPALTAAVLAQMPQLKWVQATYAGVERLMPANLRRDYCLTNVREVFGPFMSEYVFGSILSLERQFCAARAYQSAQQWQPERLTYRGLQGLTLGIAGLGSIGLHLAQTAQHFGMQVSGLKRSKARLETEIPVYTPDQAQTFLEALDYLVLVLPDTPHTKHFINAETLKYLKPEAVLINVGRGASVHEAALIDALQQHKLRAAVLDVFEHEPLPVDSALWQLPNVYLTPHVAAHSFPPQIVSIFAENYERFRNNEPLLYEVDFERGY